MEPEEECFVYPAITKPYSQPTAPPPPHNDPDEACVLKLMPRSPEKPKRSSLRNPTLVDNTYGKRDELLSQRSNKELNGTRAGLNRTTSNVTFNSDDDAFLPSSKSPLRKLDPQSDSKLPEKKLSIQNVRKYSVVDPNATRFVEGKPFFACHREVITNHFLKQ